MNQGIVARREHGQEDSKNGIEGSIRIEYTVYDRAVTEVLIVDVLPSEYVS
jgi:hypothetical protein